MSARAIRRVALWLLVGFVVLILVIFAAVHTPPARRYVLGMIQGYIADLRVESLSYNLTAGTAALIGIELGSESEPFLTAARVDVDLSLWSAIRGEPVVENMTIRDLAVNLIVDENGNTNIPEFGEDDGQPASNELPNFLIQRAAANGSFSFRGPDAAVSIPAWRLGITGQEGPRHAVNFGIEQPGTAQYVLQGEQQTSDISTLQLNAGFTRDELTVEQLRAVVTGADVTASGTMEGFAERDLDVRLSAAAGLVPLLGPIAREQNLSGQIMANVFAMGQVGQLQVSTDISGDNLTADRLRQIDLVAQATWNQTDQVLRVASARVQVPEGAITAQAIIGTGTGATQNEATARIERLDLARVSRLFDLPVQIASTLTGSLDAQWQGTAFEAADATADLRLVARNVDPSREVIPLSGSLDARLRNQQVNLTARDLAAFGAIANAEVQTHLERRNLAGSLRAEVPDAAQTLNALDVTMETPATGQLSLNADLGGTLDRPTAAAQLAGSNIDYGQVRGLSLNARANYSPESVEVPNAVVMWEGSRVTAQGRVGLEGPRPLQFTASSTELAIADLLSVAGRMDPVTGLVAFTAEGTGTLDAPRIAATLTGRELAAYQEPLGDLLARVNYTDPLVDVTELRLTRPMDLGTLTGTAQYNLMAHSYTVDLQGDNLAINQPQVSAVIDAAISGRGTVDNPMADLNVTASNVVSQGRMLGEVRLSGTVANQVADLNLAAPAFNVRADAEISTQAPYNTTARVFLDNTDLATLPIAEPGTGQEPPVRGNVTAQIDAAAPLERWREGEVNASIPSLRVETDAGQFTNTAPIRLAYRNERVEVDSLQIAGEGTTLSAMGSLPLTGRLPGTIGLQGTVDLSALPLGEDVQASGRVEIAGAVMGTLERLAPTAKINVMDARYASTALPAPVENVQLQASLGGGLLTIDQLSARLGTGLVSGEGAVPLNLFPLPEILDIPEMTDPAQFQLALTGLSFDSVAELPENTNGTITLTVNGRATRPELEAITAEATINQLIVASRGVRVQTTEPPRITLANGAVNIDRFHLSGPGTSLDVSGGASITDRRLQDVRLNGTVNAGLLNTFSEDLRASGDVMIQVTAAGMFTEPSINGAIAMNDGTFSLADPRVDATNLQMNLALQGQQITIQRLMGDLNGGTLSASGNVNLAGGITPNVQLMLDDVFMDIPEGLQTRVSADLGLAPRDTNLLLSGTATIHEGGYSEPLDLQRALEEYLGGGGGGVELVEDRDPLLSRLQFDIAVDSEEPIIVDNNLGKLAIATDVRLVGDFYRPGLTGAINIAEGGRLRLQERDYVIERGTVNFVNETRIQPVLDIVADTQVRNTNITVTITTDAAGETDTQLTSDNPDYTRADLISLLLTGKTAEELEGGALAEAGERAALSLIAGSITGRLSQQVESGLGTTAVRIEPNLISQESDPTARLTIGQDLTQFLQLIYSMNLRNSSDQIWSVNYNIRPNINLRSTKQQDNSYRFDFQHDLRFGLDRPQTEGERMRDPRAIGSVEFTGNLAVPEAEIRKNFGVETGDEYNFFDIRDGLDELEQLYRNRGYLEARVRLNRQEQDSTVNLRVNVESGPQVDFIFEGLEPSGSMRNDVRDAWQRGVFDTQRTDGSLARIREHLGRDGFLRPMLEAEIRMPGENRKSILFTIDRGTRYKGAEMAFEGAQGIEPDELRDELDQAELLEDPRAARDFLVTYYRQHGFLDVQVETPEYEYNEDAGTARLVTRIEEGPHYRFGMLNVVGADAIAESQIRAAAEIPEGGFYSPQAAQDARDRVETAYWERGYRDVVIDFALTRDSDEAVVNVNASIQEGPQSIVREVEVAGTQVTSPNFVRGQIEFQPGAVYDFTKAIDSRRNLYATGAFSAVELRAVPVAPDVLGPYKDIRLLATVQEPNPFRLRYGGFFDTDRGPGAILDLRNTNSLGGGRVIGFRSRYDYDVREGRIFFSQPLIRTIPLRTDAATFARREFQRTDLEDGTEDVIITDRIGFSAQEGLQLRDKFFLTFGYRFERAHTFEQEPDPFLPFDETIDTAPLTATLTREDRDDILDATRGSFTSHAFELSLASLGADLRFWRYFGQYFRYFPLTDPSPVPLAGGLEKPRFVFATGARVGLSRGLGGQSVVRSQRFFTGGGTTLRGFEQDTVGPTDILGRPNGGEAMFVLNNELRFPVFSIFDGVGFLDLGNVYPRIEDFSLTGIRKTGGFGIRVRTPYFLLRADYGVKLDRRAGESRGEIFFSIGQAF